ncbi:MAG: BatA domain-containing protein [candidate division KSB1 bacterium]|nr:BatA domain-containing protein [candidate division KSB1 bacterium]MDZ7275745.1 BatA domain-containing protein [candidate division KSB1 bacterium]MDZ7284564.1 BatA domain-containing protein [candidate division KSB1 bacterium]MDZ7298017.1 BatA domain-containing protein [candidate division KSB1 bacterium]MDZ7307732.1 BatA domain-containing protein [candidate division KSB1 bacterium]
MFGFLNSALLWAMAAVALPLLIHLLTRRKLNVVAISTLAFLKRLERENIRQLRLKQLLLLLLRMLIVALLVLAFARPTLRQNSVALAQRARTTAVLIIDNSLSMTAAPEGVSFLAMARRQVQEMADLFATGDEIYLITAAKPAALLPGGPFVEAERLREVVQTVPQTWAETDLAGALALGRSLLEKTRNVNREIYLFSDGRAANLPELPALPGVRGYFVRYNRPPATNLMLSGAVLRNQIFERGKSFEVTATVANHGTNDVQSQLLHLYLNDKRVAQQSVAVPAGTQRAVTFRAISDTTGFIRSRLALEDDDLPFDNTQYFTFYIPPHRRLLAVSERPDDLIFLRAALQAPSASTAAATPSWKEITTRELAAERLQDYDGIVLANVSRFAEGVAERLISFLNSGGGVILFPGRDVDLRHYNETLLSRLAIGAFGETMGSLAQPENFMQLGRIDFSHPLFDGVFENMDDKPRVDSPRFRFAVQMRLLPGTNSIIDYSNQQPFLIERRVGSGRLLLFTSALQEDWSDFAFKGIFVPLLHRSVAYVAQSHDHLQAAATVGSELGSVLRQPAEELVVELPTGELLKAPVQVTGQNYHVRVTETAAPGFYQLRDRDRVVHTWAVNFNASELSTPPLAETALAAAAGVSAFAPLSGEGRVREQIQAARYGSELWQIFLLAALLAMIVEMLLYRSRAEAGTASRSAAVGLPWEKAEVD